MRVYLFIDVGGTELKVYLFSDTGTPLFNAPKKFPSLADQSANTIWNNFVHIFENIYDDSFEVAGVGMAFPGPFDYEKGVSLMQGLAKYDAIYGLSIVHEIRRRSSHKWLQQVPWVFLHDVAAFALGVCSLTKYQKFERIIHLCIGTGAGSAFTRAGNLVIDSPEVPANGWIYNTPFKDSVIDDYISVRGFAKLSKAYLGESLDGYHAQKLAEAGSVQAREVFYQFGVHMTDALKPFLFSFRPQSLVLGGQMAKGFTFFSEPLIAFCKPHNIKICYEYDTSEIICRGLYTEYKKRIK